ncbi:MATE family efflux transporter [Treponema sp.]|uniref:MATE family efflux transporter n=1 Tax=Treponema sp. TaxID=166 RepID=UPI0025FE3EF7|nr:MATE family efflux transporter [Treponema sp.]MCR5218419.1 MATE family efflux transporter [Treponema sp.]
MAKKIEMLSGSISDKILLFAIPLALTGILQQLFNAADVMIVGRYSSKYAMAAVGSNTPVIGLLINLFLGISLGVNVVIARYIGLKNQNKINSATGTAVIISIAGGLLFAAIGQIIAVPVLSLMSIPENVFPMATSYFRIYMMGMPAIFLYNFESAIFRSYGDTKTPLYCLVIAGLLNVALNLFFTICLKRNADGVAIATVISNVVSSLIMFVILMKNKNGIHIEKSCLKIDGPVLKEILKIGIPAGVQSMLFSFSNIIIQSSINSLGADIMAASAAAFNIEIFAYFVVNAFGQAASTFIGQNYGAGQIERCKKVTRRALALDMAFTIVISFIIIIFAGRILYFFNEDPAVISYGRTRIYFITWFQLVNVLIEVFSGALRGYGQSFAPAVISFFGVCGVRITWVYTIFNNHKDFNTLLTCYPISWCVTAAILTGYYFWFNRKKVHMENAL